MRDTNQQHRHQNAYFNREFSNINAYRLAPWQQSYLDKIRKHMVNANATDQSLLDIASGSGYAAIEMARQNFNVTACDMSVVAIRNLEKYSDQFALKNLDIIQCPAEKIPLADNSSDYIVANAILEHIYDEDKAINEWLRLLKPNGKSLVTVPLMYRYIWPFYGPVNYIHDKRIGHLRRYNSASLQSKFNLELIHVFYTRHLTKVFGAAVSFIHPLSGSAEHCEKIDQNKQHKPYGANNIIAIMRKNEKQI